MRLKTIFMGTPDFAAMALATLLAEPCVEVVAAFTQPPRPKGRGHVMTPSPVQMLAQQHGIPVHHPVSFKRAPESIDHFGSYAPDVGVVAAYGLLLPPPILAAPRFGCLNIHASLLPRWRGASPIQHALLCGDAQTGITIMQMDAGLDTGPMIDRTAIPITPRMRAPDLHDALGSLGAARIVAVLQDLARMGRLDHTPQDNALATLAPKLTRTMGRIDWNAPADAIDRQVRALTPWPGTFFVGPAETRFRVLEAMPAEGQSPVASPPGMLLNRKGDVACGDGRILTIRQLAPDQGKAMSVEAAINGGYLKVMDCLA